MRAYEHTNSSYSLIVTHFFLAQFILRIWLHIKMIFQVVHFVHFIITCLFDHDLIWKRETGC